jgi:hypothetical protein
MKEELGGWIFHSRVDFTKPTPWVVISKSEPEVMRTKENLFQEKNS